MKRVVVTAFALLLSLFVIIPQAAAETITFTDSSSDAIGVGFETYWVKITNPYSPAAQPIGLEIATDYPATGITVGAWATRPADFFFYDSTGNYAIPLVSHDGFSAGSWYRVTSFAVSDDFAPSSGGYIYTHDVPVSITAGTFLGQQSAVNWVTNPDGTSKWVIDLPPGTVYEDVPSFSFVWGTATCANDVIEGSYTAVPDGGATVALLGFALIGLGTLRRKLR